MTNCMHVRLPRWEKARSAVYNVLEEFLAARLDAAQHRMQNDILEKEKYEVVHVHTHAGAMQNCFKI